MGFKPFWINIWNIIKATYARKYTALHQRFGKNAIQNDVVKIGGHPFAVFLLQVFLLFDFCSVFYDSIGVQNVLLVMGLLLHLLNFPPKHWL